MGEDSAVDLGQLDEQFLTFSAFLLARARSRFTFDTMPRQINMRHTILSDTQSTVQFALSPDYSFLSLLFPKEEMSSTPEIDNCLRRHHQLGILRYPYYIAGDPTFEHGEIVLFQLMTRPLADAIENAQSLDPTSDQLLEAYRTYRTSWQQEEVAVEISVPLVNFNALIDTPQRLSPSFSLTELTIDEKNEMWNMIQPWVTPVAVRSIEFHALQLAHYKLTGSRRQSRTASTESIAYDAEITQILTALRLLKPGTVGAPAFVERVKKPDTWLASGRSGQTNDHDVRQFGGAYTLMSQDLPQLLRLIEELALVNNRSGKSGLAVALRRLNLAYARESSEDRIIDLTIALESTLLAETRDELKYRLALRGAGLLALGASGSKRRPPEVSQLLRGMYDIRSSIVHAGKMLYELGDQISAAAPSVSPDQFPDICEDVTRNVIRAYVELIASRQMESGASISLNQVNQDLDKRIVGWIPFSPVV